MKEYTPILEEFSDRGYAMYSSTIPAPDWGNRKVAETYLEHYWLSRQDYESTWKAVLDRIFINQEIGLPQMVFAPVYRLQASRGGCLFVEEELMRLQECTQAVSDRFLFVIENTFGGRVKAPIFRMKFPSNISWCEINSGNFASAILLEMPHKEYFVFGDSGTWGKYIASDYDSPLDILGFTKDVANLFTSNIKVHAPEQYEVIHSLCSEYESRLVP